MKGIRLKQAREALNLKQEDIADRLQIGQSAYSKMERGKSDFSDELLSLIPELGINLNWVISGKGEMFLIKEVEPEDTQNLLGEMRDHVRSMREDMDTIERTIEKLMGRKRKIISV